MTPQPLGAERLGLLTLICHLFGGHSAILRIAGNRHSLWIGLLFVLSAGFAREYDAEDLLHEPFYLFLPLLASLGSSFALFLLVYGIAMGKGEPEGEFGSRYLSFLGLFWLTAPLAWLYAIPYERFLSPIDSTVANLMTLGVVSLWRVALMVRVLRVAFGYSWKASIGLVMVFADTVAILLMLASPVPLIDVMGGLHLTEREALSRDITLAVLKAGFLGFPIWILLGVSGSLRSQPRWRAGVVSWRRPALTLIALPLVALAIWIPILPRTQPEQQRRREIERLYAAGDVGSVMARLSASSLEDYPPHWHPPTPNNRQFLSEKEWVVIVEHLAEEEVAAWVRQKYIEQLRSEFVNRRWLYLELGERAHLLGMALERIPEGVELLDELEGHPEKHIIDALKGRREKR